MRKLSASPSDFLVRMVEIPSPSGAEEAVSLYIAEEMRLLGFQVRRDSAGNAIGVFGSGKPRLLLSGHMDTVASQIPVKVEDGVLHGRGAADAKAPLASLILAAVRVSSGFPGTITVAAVVDEEGKNAGIRNLIRDGADYDYAIFGEPTNVDTITVGYKGNISFKVTCETETGHSSAPWLFENSVEKAMELWAEIKGLATKPVDGSRFGTVTASLRKIEGGQQNNIVPPRCDFQVDMRVPPGCTVAELEGRINGIIWDYAKRNPAVRVSYSMIDSSEPYISPEKNILTRALTSAIYQIRKSQVRLVKKTGSGDMNIFGNETGIPSVTYGPGNSHFDHTPNEQVVLQDYLDGIEVLSDALRRVPLLYGKHNLKN